MHGFEAYERLKTIPVLIALVALFIIAALILLTGCSEESLPPRVLDIDPPRIIAVDPAPAVLFDDWITYRHISKDHPVLYLPFHGVRNQRVELTFSYPPEELSINKQFWFNYNDPRKVVIIIYHCSTGASFAAYPHFLDLDVLNVAWKGGGKQFALWCQEEDSTQ